ncbi:MAG: AAA family ATPase [bacterium]
MQNKTDLVVLIRSSTPLITIETSEEDRVIELFKQTISSVWRPLFTWTITDGLKRLDIDFEPPPLYSGDQQDEPVRSLKKIKDTRERGIYLLLDFHHFLKDPIAIRLLKEISQQSQTEHTLVMISPEINLPDSLKKIGMNFQLKLPTIEALTQLVKEEAFEWSRQNSGQRVKVNRRSMELLIQNLKGLPLRDARRLARNAIYNDGAISDIDIPNVMKAKFRLLNQGGVLNFEYETAKFSEVAGLNQLKKWIRQRRSIFHDQNPPPGLDAPRGVLLLGIQGCGKSLAAKAIAGTLGVPLLRLDFGSIYNMYHGESEKNLRESLSTAQTMAPCVLWVDEIEKGISTSQTDGGTSQRILGTLLTWMAERKQPVFLVATANDVSQLPPELIRKGRLDEIFFVDLPDASTRKEILKIHLEKRELDSEHFDLNDLASLCKGFSGSELEQLVVSALYQSFNDGIPLNQEHLFEAANSTHPLSRVMAEKVQALRNWAQNRTVRA